MTSPDGMKFLIDLGKLKALLDREGNDLGEAMIADAEEQKRVSLSPSARHLAISSFETGYAAALNNVIKILECQPPAPVNPPAIPPIKGGR